MAGRGTQRTWVQVIRSASPALILSATSMLVACTCLTLLLAQVAEIHRMRAELRDLQVRVEGEKDAWRCGAMVPAQANDALAMRDHTRVRTRRDRKQRRQRQLGKPGRRSLLHLVPLSSHSYDEDDETLLKWTTGHSQGEGLKLSGETVTVSTEGLYFIYSQVLYADSIYVMGHVIKKRIEESETSLLKCIKSMPNSTEALNSCYTAGVHYLESGSVVELSVPRKDAEISLLPHATFMGLYRL